MVGYRFNTIGVSDAISMGTDGMSFSLQSRDLIADSIETVRAGATSASFLGCHPTQRTHRVHLCSGLSAACVEPSFGCTETLCSALLCVYLIKYCAVPGQCANKTAAELQCLPDRSSSCTLTRLPEVDARPCICGAGDERAVVRRQHLAARLRQEQCALAVGSRAALLSGKSWVHQLMHHYVHMKC